MLINKEALDFSYDIEDKKELIYERPEVEELKNGVLRFWTGEGFSFFNIINCVSGSGKTVSIKYLLVEIFKKYPEFSKNFVYISGNDIRTPKRMYQTIVTQLGGQFFA